MKRLQKFIPLLNLLKQEKKYIIIAAIAIFLTSIAGVFTGYLNGAAVEAITNLEIKKSITYLVVYFLLETVICVFLYEIGDSFLLKAESIITRRLGFNTYVKALNLPAEAYEVKSSGEIINRITNDADSLSFTFGKFLKVITHLFSTFIVMIYIFINSWIIGIEIISLVIILFFIIKKFNKQLKEMHKQRKEEQDKFTSTVTESIRGIREIKTLGIKNNLIKNTQDIIKLIFKKSAKEIDISRKFNICTGFIKNIMEVGTFILCVILLYNKQITLTFFVAMTYYVYRYTWLIENINNLTQTYQKVAVSIERVNEILENKLYEDEKFGDKEVKDCKGVIEFKDVTFSYPNEDETLNKFNLKIEPNKKIAIVGKSGQGKSTLFNLITRIFDTKSGSILIDNIDIKDLTEKSLRKNVSIIRQEPFIFNLSIIDNFKLIDENITLKEIRKYCKLAYIDDYIMSLPKKYKTILGEGGVNLSGGQKQRLSIARTLSKKSKIILFDEATSALDNESQEYIKKAIDNLSKDHTVVIVAHRLSTIMDADLIHVVDNGKIVESGTHTELLKTSKIYKTLYNTET